MIKTIILSGWQVNDRRQQSCTPFDQGYSRANSRQITTVVGIVYGFLNVRVRLVHSGVYSDIAISMFS